MNNKKKISALLLLATMVSPYGNYIVRANTESVEATKNINLKGEDVLKAQKEGALIIDVRESKEFNEGHIKGAINLYVETIENEIEKVESNKSRKIVLYCNTGNKSKKAYDKLKKIGYTNIFNGQGVKEYTYDLVKTDEENLTKLQVRLVDKEKRPLTQEIKVNIKDIWCEVVCEGYNIVSKNGILDFTDVVSSQGFDDQGYYKVEIKSPAYTKILNLSDSDNEDNKNVVVFKKDEKTGEYAVKKFLKDDTSSNFKELVLDIQSKDSVTYEKGEEVTISDITVVDEKGNSLADNTLFETFNKENKDMKDYKVVNGKLSNVKAKVGDRMKLGLQIQSQKDFTLMDKKEVSTYFNYVWFKVNENGKAIRFDDVTGEEIGELSKITAINKNTLVGSKPSTEKVKYEINLYDITSKDSVKEDELKFSITGDGETREVVAKKGTLSLELYKNTKYTINLIRTMKNSYKMNGFSFTLGNDGKLMTEDNKELKTIDVYQGTYLNRVYVLYKGKFPVEGLEFEIKEDSKDGKGKIQTRKTEGKFLNFDTELRKSYTITLKENNRGYTMDPVHITLRKYEGDGLYWPMLDKDKIKKGDDGKLKALFLKKDGEKVADTSIPDGGCGNSGCEIGKEIIKPKSILVKSDDNSNVNGMVFKLFNSSTQRYEKDVVVKDGKINLELFSNNKYFLQLVNDKYFAHNTYIQANKNDGALINPKTDREETVVNIYKKSKEEKGTNRYKQSLEVIHNGKSVDGVTLEFVSENDTFRATSKNGTVEFDILEDVTYTVRSLDKKYETLTFPLVLKDKMEWGKLGDKRLFDHTSCNSVSAIILYDKGKVDNSGQLKSSLGTFTLSGMKFNNLELNIEVLDKDEFNSLKSKDVEIFDLSLINIFRCEKTKVVGGDFKIQKTLLEQKDVKNVYYIDDNEKQIPLEFIQQGQFLTINTSELGLKKLVIEYKSDSTTSKTGNSGNTMKKESNKKDDSNKGKNEINNKNKDNLTNTDLNKEEVKFILGENQTINLKDCKNIEFKLNQKVEDFVNLYVDEVLVDKSMYIVKKGSTIVEVKKEFLDTLKSGKHEFKFEFKKGIAKTNVVLENSKKENKEENKNTKIKNKESKKQNLPKTNISSISLSLISALGVSILGAFESLKRRK